MQDSGSIEHRGRREGEVDEGLQVGQDQRIGRTRHPFVCHMLRWSRVGALSCCVGTRSQALSGDKQVVLVID